MLNKSDIKIIANKLNIDTKTVELVYKKYWEFIMNTIKELPLKDIESKEDLDKLKVNFNIPNIGKLNCTYSKIIKHRNKIKYLNNGND